MIAWCILVISVGLNIIYGIYYNKTKKTIKSLKELSTHKHGYYEYKPNLITNIYDGIVYITELDRYSNGMSKIKLDKVEAYRKGYNNEVYHRVNEIFISLKETKEIEWLESSGEIKKLRKEKLDSLEKNKLFSN